MDNYAYLINVEQNGNHNKFYEFKNEGDGFFSVRYGRMGASGVVRRYPISAWERKYNEKIKKGYIDRTPLKINAVSYDMEYQEIKDPIVRSFMDDILAYADQNIKKSYRVSVKEVTPAMIEKASSVLESIQNIDNLTMFNRKLIQLFTIIPRRMHNVDDYLLKDISKKQDLLYREYEILDQMSAKVRYEEKKSSTKKTILEAEKMSVELVTDPKRIDQIKKHLGEMNKVFYRAFRVKNERLDDLFEKKMQQHNYTNKDIHYLYHGSRNANWYSIMTKGLLLRPNAIRTGSMFGNGLYFANKARKSTGYTSLKGYSTWTHEAAKQSFIAVYKVLYHSPMHVQRWINSYKYLNSNSIKPYDALFAHGGYDLINDEIVIYEENQMTLQYIIELKV